MVIPKKDLEKISKFDHKLTEEQEKALLNDKETIEFKILVAKDFSIAGFTKESYENWVKLKEKNLDLDTIEKYNIPVYRMDTDIMLSKECESLYGELKVENLELKSKLEKQDDINKVQLKEMKTQSDKLVKQDIEMKDLKSEIEYLKSLLPTS